MRTTSNASRFPVTLTTTAPLHHGAFGQDTGNAVLFRRIPLATDPDGAGVPVLTGNALRGGLRRVLMRDLFALTGLGLESVESGELTAHQWDRLYAALANGGHLTGADTRSDPASQRVLGAAVPALAVLGAALYSHMLPGKVSVGWVWPVCAETVAAGLCVAGATPPVAAESLLTEVTLTRHVDRDEQSPERSGVTPMPVTVESLIPGVALSTEVVALRACTDIEMGAIGWALDALRVLGGKGGVGFGRFTVTHQLPSAAYEAWRADAEAVALARMTLVTLAQGMA